MGMIYIMLIVSLVLALFFLVSYLWATKTGQYEDDYSPSVRILYDEEIIEVEKKENSNQQTHGN